MRTPSPRSVPRLWLRGDSAYEYRERCRRLQWPKRALDLEAARIAERRICDGHCVDSCRCAFALASFMAPAKELAAHEKQIETAAPRSELRAQFERP